MSMTRARLWRSRHSTSLRMDAGSPMCFFFNFWSSFYNAYTERWNEKFVQIAATTTMEWVCHSEEDRCNLCRWIEPARNGLEFLKITWAGGISPQRRTRQDLHHHQARHRQGACLVTQCVAACSPAGQAWPAGLRAATYWVTKQAPPPPTFSRGRMGCALSCAVW